MNKILIGIIIIIFLLFITGCRNNISEEVCNDINKTIAEEENVHVYMLGEDCIMEEEKATHVIKMYCKIGLYSHINLIFKYDINQTNIDTFNQFEGLCEITENYKIKR